MTDHGLPINLVYIRHGESERNAAHRRAKLTGDQGAFGELLTRPTARARLTPEGRRQVEVTGKWIREDLGLTFSQMITSRHDRAIETATLLDLPNAEWSIKNRIRERSNGVMEGMNFEERAAYLENLKIKYHTLDPFNFRPDDGDSFADAEERLRGFLYTLGRDYSDDNVVVVGHGDNMWVARYIHEHMQTHELIALRGVDPGSIIPNCAVLHYTRVNPHNGVIQRKYGWTRLCCPWKDPDPGEWKPIVRRRYSTEDLRAMLEKPTSN